MSALYGTDADAGSSQAGSVNGEKWPAAVEVAVGTGAPGATTGGGNGAVVAPWIRPTWVGPAATTGHSGSTST